MSNFEQLQTNRFVEGSRQQQQVISVASTNAKTTSGHSSAANKIMHNQQFKQHNIKSPNALARAAALHLGPTAAGMSRPTSLGQARVKQRKWRVLVSIALLLPALAAIIGIVAWTISVEVTNSDQRQHHTNNHRHQNHHLHPHHSQSQLQQQQLPLQSSQLNNNNDNDNNNHLQQQNPKTVSRVPLSDQFRSREADPVGPAPRRAARAQQQQLSRPKANELEPAAVMAPLKSASTNQDEQAQPEAKKTQKRQRGQAKLDSVAMVASDDNDDEIEQEQGEQQQKGTLILRNLNQVESLSGSTNGKSSSEIRDGLNEQTDNGNGRSEDFAVSTREQAVVESMMNDDQNTELRGKADDDSTMNVDGEREQQLPAEHRKADEELPSDMTQQYQDTTTTTTTTTLAPTKHKSQRMNYGGFSSAMSNESSTANKQRQPVLSSFTSDTASSIGAEQSSEARKKIRAPTKQASKQSQNNKYILAGTGEHERTLLGSSSEQNAAPEASKQDSSERKQQQQQVDEDISFEQIASAISSTLSQEAESSLLKDSAGNSRELSTDEQSRRQPWEQPEEQPARRRTTGEHVAEVIDHLVGRRWQQQQQQRQQQSLQSEQEQEQQLRPQLGPQVVVVAPVGPHGAHMRARSLVKEQDESKQATKKATQLAKKPQQQMSDKSASNDQSKAKKPLGARLLGQADTGLTGDQTKYSERVEVIEDNDSSDLLGAADNSPSNDDEELGSKDNNKPQDFDLLFPHSSHVSSDSTEPRLRSPRHFNQRNEFERYPAQISQAPAPQMMTMQVAPSTVNQQRLPIINQQQQLQMPQQLQTPQQQQPLKLYSAEQLIRDHVQKSRLRNATEQQQQLATATNPVRVTLPNRQASLQQQQVTIVAPRQQQRQQQQPRHIDQSKAIITTTSTTTQASTNATSSNPVPTQDSMKATSGNVREEPVPKRPQMFTVARNPQQPIDGQRQEGQRQQQQLSSSFQSVQVPAFYMDGPAQQQQSMIMRPQQQSDEAFQLMESQQVTQQQPAPAAQTMEQQQQSLPVFQDQEIQVPAHMADSVIQDLQRSPSQVTGYLNGKPATFQSIVDHQPMQQYNNQVQVPAMAATASGSPHQHQQFNNRYNPKQQFYAPYHQVQHHAAFNLGQKTMAVAARREQEQKSSKNSKASLLSKALAPGGFVQPMAQRAFNNLLNSFSQQAAEQQAQLEADSHETRYSAGQQRRPAGDPMQAADSAPEPAAAPAASRTGDERGSVVSARSMRSLPIGARAPVNQQQLQVINDQEVAESSYGQMPQYHMGGGDYHAPQQHYQNEHDKKTKGITFHFGGGPIGGGTQLITSPMGIFRHLMIPLMPNPRVNLNGKVVFGVVLEKTTAFGPPPKKKYKFWG